MSDFEYLWNRRVDIRLRVLTNRMYHQERQRIFDLREGMVKVVSILAGSATIAKIANPEIVQWCAVVITASSAASLVFGFGAKSRDSGKRSADWALIERDIEARGERGFDEEDLSKWLARCNELEAGEPAAHPGLFERSHLRACEALGVTPSAVSFWRRHRPAVLIP